MESKWTSLNAASLLCFQSRGTTATTKVRFQTCCVLSALSVVPQVSKRIYRVSFRKSAKTNFFPVLEVARWQRLTAKPDWTYRAFYQTGFFSAHAGGFTTGQNVTNLCLVLSRNKHLKRITPGIYTACGLLTINTHNKVWENNDGWSSKRKEAETVWPPSDFCGGL